MTQDKFEALINFGFGGTNASLVLKHVDASKPIARSIPFWPSAGPSTSTSGKKAITMSSRTLLNEDDADAVVLQTPHLYLRYRLGG